jgi:flavin reductase (DIM6/NTAB) family NADH-FMN oxidoreductase RutF/DNA-binding GntR family transcriptional regulator
VEEETMSAADSDATADQLDQTVFRDVIGRFASGVTVITTRAAERDFGTTASAVSSLSMDPPMLLICLNRTSDTREAILEAGWFAVNILSESQADLAFAFAKKSPDKFARAEVERGPNGMPLIPGALAQMGCRVTETATGGTHTVFMGEVVHATATEDAPLTYYRGRFGRFEEMLEDVAYRKLRTLVISREIAPGRTLDAEALARDLDLDAKHVMVALSKLAADGLLAQHPDGTLSVRALDVRTAHEAIDARCAIEIAVVDKVSGRIDPADVERLQALADATRVAAHAQPPDIAELLRSGQGFHEHFIGLLDNEVLKSFFQRLDFRGIWSRAAPDLASFGRTTPAYLDRLVAACAAGDGDLARQLLYDHAEAVKQDATDAIERSGGEI